MDYKKTFIELAIKKDALKFGSYKLKSERISPYFFNSGVFSDGKSLSVISNLFIELIKEKNLKFINIFGPAYKGISLASALSASLASKHNEETHFIYDRKDQKLHGEKGDIVGTFKNGNTIIVDDVITAGTAIKNTLVKLEKYNLKITSLLVLLDRQEKGSSSISAAEEMQKEFNIDVYSLISISDIIEYVTNTKEFEKFRDSIIEYKEKYGS
ncbi:MAG: orotate phosphoribosyltransferase [Gammaproteobacteria bacterium]|nr:orotate phosphoribosyltransferase [Gammaproteobacteria bacterium]|tara:strand:- start:14019 stop:14657 length:639 start_codon:yes stop_codon:yes gene_type:complete